MNVHLDFLSQLQAESEPRGVTTRGYDSGHVAPDATFVDTTSGMQWTGHAAISGMLAWFYEGQGFPP